MSKLTTGDIIKQLRKQKGLTQEELAIIIGVVPNTILRYEKGERLPDYERMMKLIQFFGVSAAYLNGDLDNPSPLTPCSEAHNTPQKILRSIEPEESVTLSISRSTDGISLANSLHAAAQFVSCLEEGTYELQLMISRKEG